MNLRGDVPFPGKISRILRGLQNLGDSLHIASEIALVSRESGVVHHMSDSRLMWVSSGQETCPGGAASSGIVELSESQTVLGQTVEVGSFDLAAVASDVGPTHIVCHHDDDVWSALTVGGGAEKKSKKECWGFHVMIGAIGFLLARRGGSQYLTRVLENGAVAKW